MRFRGNVLVFLLHTVLFLFPFMGTGAEEIQKSDVEKDLVYPVPPSSDKLLFYIQRSKNTNAIVYETNLKPDGNIDTHEPVRVYWIRYSSDSTMAELNYIQRKYAYGIESRQIEGKPGQFIINLVSYRERKIYLIPLSGGRKYEAITTINGVMSVLDRIFIKLNGGSFWIPEIEYIELKGRDPQSGKVVVEKFKPSND